MSQISRLRDAEISNGNLINADDIDTELNQLVSESNSQDTRLTNIESSAMTIAGVKTFSSTPKMDQIDERTLNAGVTISSVLHKSGVIRLSPVAGYTPSANGELGYDSAVNCYKVMENSIVKTLNTTPLVSAKSAAYTAVLTDRGAVFIGTSTFTFSLTAAATLGAGWMCEIRNDGTGIITIDPNASETIDGQITITLYPGETYTLVCDGSNFKALGRQRGLILLQSQTASNVASVDFTNYIGSDFDEYVLEYNGVYMGTASSDLWLRVSQDGGSTWKSGASDYKYNVKFSNTGATFGSVESATDTKIVLARTMSNAASAPVDGITRFFRPSDTNGDKAFMTDNYNFSSTQKERGLGYGFYQTDAGAINAIRFLASSGNLYGTFRLYGVRK